ncbi:DUF1080 domain-containing protein [Dyadobacter sp. CY326]|uniref:3-keto-disaccharide hydrolase n=1 Tax=Dyadobacter sp. CY326 TaxID=2907300 RepID=UPI001F26D3E6|nr:DUF1080 domain-containing protein [Dyadobacter sp. CY326]MCE7063927.1 DUF1080 domain-containing protein [Dyadobacter sp. CY326]
MKRFFKTCLLSLAFFPAAFSNNFNSHPAQPAAAPIEGRWDITVDMAGKMAPSWLEVRHSGNHTLIGQFTSVSGSARPISEVHFKDGKFNFEIPPQWEKGDKNFTLEGTLTGEKLAGSVSTPDGKTYTFTGVRAPSLRRTAAPVWGTPIKLTDGNQIKGWHAAGENQWVAENGILRSPKSGANLITDQKFNDFKLHVEFRIPKGSNSGVYLRGRYEVQVTDSKGMEPSLDQLGAVYGFLVPSEMMAKDPGEWQSFDITLVGRMLTLVTNGKTVITNQEIPGITGGALDSNEGEPGPLYIQGDHGPVEYRNIVITPAK